MSKLKIRKTFFGKMRHKYRLIIYNDNSFEEILSFKLTKLNVFMLSGFLMIFFMALVYYTIALTPLKAYVIPDFPKAEERQGIIKNALKVDSLEYQLRLYEDYMQKMKMVMMGEDIPSYNQYGKDSTIPFQNVRITHSKDDSILRKQVEQEEEFSLNLYDEGSTDFLSGIFFYTPVHGVVTNLINPSQGHYGVDVVTTKDNMVHSIMDGTVTFSQWTLETGYVVQVQHDKDMISVYKHCAKILKQVGSKVTTGEAIAIVGNTGEITTGPHLHFELWLKGVAIDPTKYIDFE